MTKKNTIGYCSLAFGLLILVLLVIHEVFNCLVIDWDALIPNSMAWVVAVGSLLTFAGIVFALWEDKKDA